MKKILLKSLYLILLTITLVFAYLKIEERLFDKNISFKINSETNYAVFGHSHAETAFNDSLITNFQNFSKSGDAYFYIYPKIKKIVEENKNLKIVLIEFSNNQVFKLMDEWTWGDKNITYRFNNYEPFIDMEDQYVLLRNNFPKYFSVFFDNRKKHFWKMINNNYSWSTHRQFGGYNYLVMDKTDSLLNKLTSKRTEFGISKINIIYLVKIIRMLEKQNIKVALLRVPIHPRSTVNDNELIFNEILNKKFNSVEFLDFNAFHLETNQYGDLEHLNYRGAKVFSLWFDSIIKKGLFDKTNKQNFIDSLIMAYNKNSKEIINNLEKLKSKEKRNKDILISNILSKGTEEKIQFSFTNKLTVNKIITFANGETDHILMELSSTENDDFFNNKNFGIHLKVYTKDKGMRPQWLKDRNSYILTYKSELSLVKMNNTNYLLLSFKKKIRLEYFESIKLFIQDRGSYNGTIGKPLIINDFKL
ncbi:MAG: hypothetical protein COB12_10915 [Flavobacterium sp.]|nr:MAG: hypothetical protein COB12_10915 [Flavobacterium sp.]